LTHLQQQQRRWQKNGTTANRPRGEMVYDVGPERGLGYVGAHENTQDLEKKSKKSGLRVAENCCFLAAYNAREHPKMDFFYFGEWKK
jgi:hypothetical protein